MNLRSKLLAISSCGVAITFACAALASFFYYQQEKQLRVEQAVAEMQQNFEVAMNAKKKVWQTNALQVASNQKIVQALEVGDRGIADEVLSNLGKMFKENTGFKNVQVHLIDKDLKSFYKSWDKESYGESLGGSSGYSEVKSAGNSSAAMEMSSKGVRLKGLFPVKKGGEFLGVANFEGGLNSIKRTLKPYDIDFIYYMEKKELGKAPSMRGKPAVGPYIINQKDVDENFSKYVSSESRIREILAADYIMDGQYLTIGGQFDGFKGEKVGLYLLGMQTDVVMAEIYGFRDLLVKLFLGIFILFMLLLGVIALFIDRKVIKPIKNIADQTNDIAVGEGDLTKRVPVVSNDEIGNLAENFNLFLEKLNGMIVEIGQNSEVLTTATMELHNVAGHVADESEDLTGKANTVAAAAEEMSVNMNSVAAASEEISTNVSMVTDSASMMQSGLSDVAGNCERATGVTNEAGKQVTETSERVSLLGQAAQEISKITEVINEIADQTDLLALNATIEAARAGDAGKGFAVVAGEIKELASQTSNATSEIRLKVEEIQRSTSTTVADVEKVATVFNELKDVIEEIVSSVEEQSANASGVAGNIEQAAAGLQEVNENVSQSSHVSGEIAREIIDVKSVADNMHQKSTLMKSNSEKLSGLSTKQRQMISMFKVTEEGVDVASEKTPVTEEISDLVEWGPKLQLGIAEFDEQHRLLVDLVNKLYRAMRQSRGQHVINQVLEELAEYTVFHFGYEEKQFEAFDYPETEGHKKLHTDLVEKVVDLQDQIKKGETNVTMDVMDFLVDWLQNHILGDDKKYVPHFRGKTLVE